METKNSILTRQKDMQHSLDKVKHLIRLIHAFNFNQAQAEKEAKEDCPKVQDGASVPCPAKPEVNSVEKGTTGSIVSNSEEKHNATVNSVASGEVTEQANSVPSAENSQTGQDKSGEVSNTGTTVESQPQVKAETVVASTVTGTPPETPAITTNGTSEPVCPEHSPTGNENNTNPSSENKMAAVISAETNEQEAPNNNNNSKTSEPSQHCLPALVSSSDTDK